MQHGVLLVDAAAAAGLLISLAFFSSVDEQLVSWWVRLGWVRACSVVYMYVEMKKQSESSPNQAPTRRRFLSCLYLDSGKFSRGMTRIDLCFFVCDCPVGLSHFYIDIDGETWDNLALLDLQYRIRPIASIRFYLFIFVISFSRLLLCYWKRINTQYFELNVVNNQVLYINQRLRFVGFWIVIFTLSMNHWVGHNINF